IVAEPGPLWERSHHCGRLLQSRRRGWPATVLRGVNGFKWSTQCLSRFPGRLSDSVPVFIPGPININASTIEEYWDLLINNEMIELIVEHTNKKIEDVCAKDMAADKDMQTYHHLTDVAEMRAYLGMLYYSGLWKQSSLNYERLWDRSNGTTVYRCVMSRTRFMFLSTCLRFDEKNIRDNADKFAPICKLWNSFINNCQQYYKPHNNCTVDEQLLGFRGRCSFRMYIKSKPDKYGLKIISLNDASTSYMYNAMPYVGKTTTPVNEFVVEYFFREITPIHGSGRNITCDNWFTSILRIQRMLEAPINLRITGTIRKNKREISQEMKVAEKQTPVAKYCFTKNLTLLSYSPKKNKVVLLLTSYMHGSTQEIDGKSEIIDYHC
ncbi:piggyBac transposable element-derived protein 4, partial [Linepithema humile]|uniref:piggyBac transposable element-derived protein 4 n=1 Tax=Linepithema humile TaxID=83485 RepID=UPI00351E9787